MAVLEKTTQNVVVRRSESRLSFLLVGLPSGGIPDFQEINTADHHTLLVNTRVFTKRQRELDPPLAIG